VPTPLVWNVDLTEQTLILQRVGRADLAANPTDERVATTVRHLARLHEAGIVHGDPTTRNVRIGDRVYLLDFGLGYHSGRPEDHAMDLHVLAQSLTGTTADADRLIGVLEDAYRAAGEAAVLDRLATIEGRGRYQGGDDPEREEPTGPGR